MGQQSDLILAIAAAIENFQAGVLMPSAKDIFQVVQKTIAEYRIPTDHLACPCCRTVLPSDGFPGWDVAWEAEDAKWECGGSDGPVKSGHLEVGGWNGHAYEFDADVTLHCCPNCGAMFATNI
jgi:hypothetical protein